MLSGNIQFIHAVRFWNIGLQRFERSVGTLERVNALHRLCMMAIQCTSFISFKYSNTLYSTNLRLCFSKPSNNRIFDMQYSNSLHSHKFNLVCWCHFWDSFSDQNECVKLVGIMTTESITAVNVSDVLVWPSAHGDVTVDGFITAAETLWVGSLSWSPCAEWGALKTDSEEGFN